MMTIATEPVSTRPFIGLGMQVDSFIYDDINRQFGVTEEDCALFEERLRALRPGVVRIFLPINHFNPSFDARTYDWETPEFQRQLRLLKVLKETGAHVNVCMGPWTNSQMRQDGMERTGVDVVKYLRNEQGFDNIRWLTLFNEPDTLYYHDSPLYERLFKDRRNPEQRPWADYVSKHRETQEMLASEGLYPAVRLVVGDTVWGYQMRRERLGMCARDFGDLDVNYGYHHYAAHFPKFYGEGESDFKPPPMVEETRICRELVGPDAELVVWEFNNAGYGFGTAFPGTGPYGEDFIGTVENGVILADKVMTGLANGLDGMALWCVCDMFYASGLQQGVMYFGLWRYKWQHWTPRPNYYYYAALMHAFPPGCQLHAVDTGHPALTGLAAKQDGRLTVALVNCMDVTTSTALDCGTGGNWECLRVYPGAFPTEDLLPITAWAPFDTSLAASLEPGELTVLRQA